MQSGSGIFYDGTTSARHSVTVTLAESSLRIGSLDGAPVDEWSYGDLEALSAPKGLLRLGRRSNPVLARLDIADPALAASIGERADSIDSSGRMHRRQRISVVAWSVAATISLVLVGWFGVPLIADRLAPVIPRSVEQRLGSAVDAQIRSMLDTKNAGDEFECGTKPADQAGRAALDKLMRTLEAGAALPVPLHAAVIRRSEANAIALPGSQIYVFQGLLTKADSADELAGVIAHEIGHIAHRDGTKMVLQGGAVIIAAKTVLQSSYSRDVEAAADAYGVGLMNKIGANGRALGTMLAKIGGATEPGTEILLDHPETSSRIKAINALAMPAPLPAPLLNAPEWAALKRICGDK
jgi:hypothetical protein